MTRTKTILRAGLMAATATTLAACGMMRGTDTAQVAQAAQAVPTGAAATESSEYVIGPLDQLSIFVWRNPDLSTSVPVRPDGRISMPLVQDLMAAGRTPAELSNALEQELSEYIQDPNVTVMVNSFVGPFAQQVRVIGEAAEPQAVAYRENMSLLDLLIGVGGTTPFASGNRAVLVRGAGDTQQRIPVRLDDLMGGDISANVQLLPGDILIVPQSWF